MYQDYPSEMFSLQCMWLLHLEKLRESIRNNNSQAKNMIIVTIQFYNFIILKAEYWFYPFSLQYMVNSMNISCDLFHVDEFWSIDGNKGQNKTFSLLKILKSNTNLYLFVLYLLFLDQPLLLIPHSLGWLQPRMENSLLL